MKTTRFAQLGVPTMGQDALIIFVCISLLGVFLCAFFGARIVMALFYGIGMGAFATAIAFLGDRWTA